MTSFSDVHANSTAYGSSILTTPSSTFSQPTVGFAGNLSHTIIKEQQEDGPQNESEAVSDERLALLGPPWAKEGILQRKHYWEGPGKRSRGKEKDWQEAFVVIQKGELQMFRFGESSGPVRRGGSVGGGNWLVRPSSSSRESYG